MAKAEKALRAAQYVRMSTELQRYSTQNQAAAIAAYAQQRNLTIVRTYVDPGRSGVRINRRPGLIELIKMFNQETPISITSAEFVHRAGMASTHRVVRRVLAQSFENARRIM